MLLSELFHNDVVQTPDGIVIQPEHGLPITLQTGSDKMHAVTTCAMELRGTRRANINKPFSRRIAGVAHSYIFHCLRCV